VRWALGAAAALLVAAAAIGVVLARAPSGEGRSSILVTRVNGPKIDCLETRVVREDRATLKPIESSVRVKGAYEQPVYSPDRKAVALGGNTGTVIVVDAAHLRLTATVRVGSQGDDVRVVSWPAGDRLVAVSYTARAFRPYVTRVVVVDPERAKVAAAMSFPTADAGHAGATRAGRVPLLIVSRRELAPPRLAVVGAQGPMQTVTLGRLSAGTASQPHRMRFPGFAVDPRGERAFVIGSSGLVATVELASLDVRYRLVKGLASRTSDALQDRRRAATWLGGGRIGISGSDNSDLGFVSLPEPNSKGPPNKFVPFGLRILDTRRWQVRTLDSRPSNFEWLRGRLIVYGRSVDSRTRRERDHAVVAFDRSGRPAYTVRGDRDTYWEAFDDRLFLMTRRSRLLEVRDARDGRVVGHVPGQSLSGMGPC